MDVVYTVNGGVIASIFVTVTFGMTPPSGLQSAHQEPKLDVNADYPVNYRVTSITLDLG
jgi:hypothetical protein